MSNVSRPSLKSFDVFLATWLGSGYLPKAPGTWGSLAALPFAWGLHVTVGQWGLLAAALVVTGVGVWASQGYMAKSQTHDPGQVVIDEVAGQWIVLAVAATPSIPLYFIGFVLFRVFDVLKPWPISWADRELPGAWGVMMDDVIAGVLGGAVLYGLLYWGVL